MATLWISWSCRCPGCWRPDPDRVDMALMQGGWKKTSIKQNGLNPRYCTLRGEYITVMYSWASNKKASVGPVCCNHHHRYYSVIRRQLSQNALMRSQNFWTFVEASNVQHCIHWHVSAWGSITGKCMSRSAGKHPKSPDVDFELVSLLIWLRPRASL